MYAAALLAELRIADSHSLKQKRRVIRPLIEGMRKLGSYSVAEIGRHDAWQRATLGVAVVAPNASQLDRLLRQAESYLDDTLGVEVLETAVAHIEGPD